MCRGPIYADLVRPETSGQRHGTSSAQRHRQRGIVIPPCSGVFRFQDVTRRSAGSWCHLGFQHATETLEPRRRDTLWTDGAVMRRYCDQICYDLCDVRGNLHEAKGTGAGRSDLTLMRQRGRQTRGRRQRQLDAVCPTICRSAKRVQPSDHPLSRPPTDTSTHRPYRPHLIKEQIMLNRKFAFRKKGNVLGDKFGFSVPSPNRHGHWHHATSIAFSAVPEDKSSRCSLCTLNGIIF